MYILEKVVVTLDSSTQIPCCVSIDPEALWDEAEELNNHRVWQEHTTGDTGCGYALAYGDEWGATYYYVDYIKEI